MIRFEKLKANHLTETLKQYCEVIFKSLNPEKNISNNFTSDFDSTVLNFPNSVLIKYLLCSLC